MSALLDLVIDVLAYLFVGWLPERRALRWLVYCVYGALLLAATAFAVGLVGLE